MYYPVCGYQQVMACTILSVIISRTLGSLYFYSIYLNVAVVTVPVFVLSSSDCDHDDALLAEA